MVDLCVIGAECSVHTTERRELVTTEALHALPWDCLKASFVCHRVTCLLLFVLIYWMDYSFFCLHAFSALTLLVGHQEEHPACKKLSVRCWHDYLSGARCKWFCIWSSCCHCHPVISCFIKIQIALTFLVLAYPGCPGKEAVKWLLVACCLLE